jgi:hypothetical protein
LIKDRSDKEALANLAFSNGKLKSVMKYWEQGYQGSNPDEFVKTLYTLLEDYNKAGITSFTVTTREHKTPGVTSKIIDISSGRKTIGITFTEGLRDKDRAPIKPFVNLYEYLE